MNNFKHITTSILSIIPGRIKYMTIFVVFTFENSHRSAKRTSCNTTTSKNGLVCFLSFYRRDFIYICLFLSYSKDHSLSCSFSLLYQYVIKDLRRCSPSSSLHPLCFLYCFRSLSQTTRIVLARFRARSILLTKERYSRKWSSSFHSSIESPISHSSTLYIVLRTSNTFVSLVWHVGYPLVLSIVFNNGVVE